MRDDTYRNYGVLDLSKHDTTPGAASPLAPPLGWVGDEKAYLDLIRYRYQDLGARQHLVFAARVLEGYPESVIMRGPYRAAALKVLRALAPSRLNRSESVAASAVEGQYLQ